MKNIRKLLWITLLGLSGLDISAKEPVKTQTYRNLIASYLYFVNTDEQLAYNAKGASAYQSMMQRPYPKAQDTYNELNNDPNDRFALSYGTAMSQAKVTNNSVLPERVRHSMQKAMQKAMNARNWLKQITPEQKAHDWLSHKDRYWYALRAAKPVACQSCHVTTNPETFSGDMDSDLMHQTLNIMSNNNKNTELELNACPHCHSNDVVQLAKQTPEFGKDHQDAMVAQAEHLGVFDQFGVQDGTRPTYRLSVEQADAVDADGKVDPAKLEEQSSFWQRFKNPMLFMQHYAKYKDNQFENPEDAQEFADYCAQVIEANPNVTHACPISQPMALAFRSGSRQSLPPFGCADQAQYLKNIVQAQILAATAMKKANPKLTTMLSHQYKPFKASHAKTTFAGMKERIAKFFAHKMYNQKFINEFKEKQDSFDALALSVYPALYFNGFEPKGDNCSGKLDPEAALESIMQMHKAFPNKPIYIVETGCSSQDPAVKQEFVDMTLHACKLARDLGAPVKGCYFWGHVNDKDRYLEWNSQPGSTHFAPYDKLDTINPIRSINSFGNYLRHTLQAEA